MPEKQLKNLQKFWQQLLINIGFFKLLRLADAIRLPGFGGASLLDVILQFVRGWQQSHITTRASAISYSFFLALFPTVIFLFTILAYVPIANFSQIILNALSEVLPEYTFIAVRDTILDIVSNQRGQLLSFGFLIALYFSSNGIASIINAFTAYSGARESRPAWKVQLVSLALTLALAILLVLMTAVVVLTSLGVSYLISNDLLSGGWSVGFIRFLKWLLFYLLLNFSVSMLYALGPPKKAQFPFFSPGSAAASFLMMISIIAFSYYVSNFGTYNKLYGSIGTIMVILILIYINAFLLLLGYELNVSIRKTKFAKKLPPQSSQTYE